MNDSKTVMQVVFFFNTKKDQTGSKTCKGGGKKNENVNVTGAMTSKTRKKRKERGKKADALRANQGGWLSLCMG